MQTIGFIGLGNMGWPMAANLARAGRDLVVIDADAARVERFTAEHGGRAAASPEAMDGTDAVILMLPDADVVRDVCLARGLLAAMPQGGLLVDMSSSGPFAYEAIEPAARARRIDVVDAPVSGNTDGAAAGTLSIMAGGTDAAIDRAMPLFEVLGRTVFRTGRLGSGQAVKALNNLASAGGLMLVIELLLAAQRFGLDPAVVNGVLNASTGRNNSTDRKIEPFVLSRRFDSGFGLGLMAKDLRAAGAILEATGTEAQLGQLAIEMASAAEAELGAGADHTAVARWIEERVGARLGASEAAAV